MNGIRENRFAACPRDRKGSEDWINDAGQIVWGEWTEIVNDKPVERLGLTKSLYEKARLQTNHSCWHFHEVESLYFNEFIGKSFNITVESWSPNFTVYEVEKDDKAWYLMFRRNVIKKDDAEIKQVDVLISQQREEALSSIPQRVGAFPIIVYQGEQEDVYNAVLAAIGSLPKIPAYQHLKESGAWGQAVADPLSGYIRISAVSKFKSCEDDDTCKEQQQHAMVINVLSVGNGLTKLTVGQYVRGQEAVDGLIEILDGGFARVWSE